MLHEKGYSQHNIAETKNKKHFQVESANNKLSKLTLNVFLMKFLISATNFVFHASKEQPYTSKSINFIKAICLNVSLNPRVPGGNLANKLYILLTKSWSLNS